MRCELHSAICEEFIVYCALRHRRFAANFRTWKLEMYSSRGTQMLLLHYQFVRYVVAPSTQDDMYKYVIFSIGIKAEVLHHFLIFGR